MTNRVYENVDTGQLFLNTKVEVDETLTVDVAGTAASITDTTSYSSADQDGLSMIITILHAQRPELNLGAQTVTFSGATTTAAGVASQINSGVKQASAAVVGGQVKISTDNVGEGVSIAVTVPVADPSTLTWDTPVDGTGVYSGYTITPGTLLARTTSSSSPYTAGDIVPYDSGGTPTGADTIRGVADFTHTFSASGSKVVKMAIGGKLDKNQLSKVDGTAVTKAELDALVSNTGIVYANVVDGIDSQV